MMKRLLKKLRERAGESLVETLAAILVIALSAMMIAGAATTSTRLNVTSQNALDKLNTELTEAEAGTGSAAGKVTVDGVEIDVTYTGGSGELPSYKGA